MTPPAGAPGPSPAATPAPQFAVIGGAQVRSVLRNHERDVVRLVETGYRLHGSGQSVNPLSVFLRFPDRPACRVIALPASVGGQVRVDGLKWVSSFPQNVDAGLPRASAVLILNDYDTGYPLACLEASMISAHRTAASAALAAEVLSRGRPRPKRARYIHDYLLATGWSFTEIGLHDRSPASGEGFRRYLARSSGLARVRMHDTAGELIRSSDLVVFATVAGEPHVRTGSWFDHHPLVLHISLRDLSAEILLSGVNVVDDVDHCLRAGTSAQLAEQVTGNRDFVAGTLHDVLTERLAVPADRTVVFSPFGLGVLDLVVGKYVYDEIVGEGGLQTLGGFYDELDRYPGPGRDGQPPAAGPSR